MRNELRNKKGEIFWCDEASNAVEAINFALDKIEDPYDRLYFLVGWREGDIAEYPEFLSYLRTLKETPND